MFCYLIFDFIFSAPPLLLLFWTRRECLSLSMCTSTRMLTERPGALHHHPPAALQGIMHLTCLPIWAERTTGGPIIQDCVLCLEEGVHHAVRCRQCEQMCGCCSCIWRYQRSRYNSGCPCCRYTGLQPPNRRTPAATQMEEEDIWGAKLPELVFFRMFLLRFKVMIKCCFLAHDVTHN